MDRVSLVAMESLIALQLYIPEDEEKEPLCSIRKSISSTIPHIKALICMCADEAHSAWENAVVIEGEKQPCSCPKCDEESASAWVLSVREAIKQEVERPDE